MEINSEQNSILKIKHSKLGIIAFFIFVSMIIPFDTTLLCRWGIIQLKPEYSSFLSKVFVNWFIFAPILSLVLSIADLKRPNRLRVLPKITLILSSIIVGIGILIMIITTVSDISRIF